MGEIILRSDTKATEFAHLTAIDLELNSIILELVYLSALSAEYGSAAGKMYIFEYGGEITRVDYENPIDIWGFFKNVSKKSVEWVLDRTIFHKEEKARRQAEAAKKEAEAESVRQSAIEKKLKNLSLANKVRNEWIKGGANPDDINKVIAGLLVDQRAQLMLPPPTKKSA